MRYSTSSGLSLPLPTALDLLWAGIKNPGENMTMCLDIHLAAWCLLSGNSKGRSCLATVHPGYKSKGISLHVYKSVKAAKRIPTGRTSFLHHPRLTYRLPEHTKVIKTLH